MDNYPCQVTNLDIYPKNSIRTGMFQEEGNSKENPADYVVKDFKEAIALIFKLENLS